jgi:DNA modification methylase
MVARGWSEAQKRAYALADNRIALNAGWNDELLRLEVADLAAMGFELPLIGFSDDEIAKLSIAPNPGLTDPDEAPEPPANPVSAPGDVWQLGRHRLVCGDCTDADTVAAALEGTSPHLMVTDPPYGVDYDPGWRGQTKRTGRVLNDDRADWREAWALFPGDVAYVWHASLFVHAVAESLIASGFELRAHIVWAKDRLQLSRGHYHWQHEPCWYAVRRNASGHWTGDRRQTTLWQIANKGQDAETRHGTQKPVECMKRPMENNSSPGQAVYDPFVGSGTSIIAAEMTGRACHAVELDPGYVDVAVLRWEAFTGASAVLGNDGRTFADVAATRPHRAA